ncbi:MAG: ABC transporter permease [Chloroflexota bacterium]|nr:ABC transporter permease [Chloroflexota bacterium]
MIERFGVIFKKEVIDNLRDRRTLAAALFYPLLGPLLMALIFTVMGRTMSTQAEKPLTLPVVGAQNGPALIQFLEQNGTEIQPGPDDPEASVRAGDHDVVLVIPTGYEEDFGAGRPATVRLVVDDSRQSASISVKRASRLLEAYSQQIGTLRLLARGVDPSLVTALAVERTDVSTPQSQAAIFLNIMPYFIIFSVFMGGMYLIIDTTAGERERGSLEPLLINPVARSELVLGKLAAALVFTGVGVIETLAGFLVMLNVMPTESFGVQISLHPSAMGIIFLIVVPIMLLAAALQMIIATFTRSFKEAQNYLSFLPLIPALPGMFLVFVPVKTKLWMMLIPTFGQQLLINQVMRGESLDALNVTVSATATAIAGLALTFVAIRLYEREHILFGR